MAYNRYYGFRENPFNQTPDSSFFFPSEAHKTALDALLYSIQQRKGFAVITGEIGSGKTTVVRTLLHQLDQKNVRTAMITNTHVSPKGIITLILEDLGIEYKDGSKERLLIQLKDYLVQQMDEDANTAIIIDEAQNLSPSCLEEVRMLSNLETEKEKMIQIVLVGQPELRAKLDLPRLSQLRQRISIQYHLSPLSDEDTKKYIFHRLNTAKVNGHDYAELFDQEALSTVYHYSRGVPRVINNICDHALLAGFVSEAKTITQALTLEAVETVIGNH